MTLTRVLGLRLGKGAQPGEDWRESKEEEAEVMLFRFSLFLFALQNLVTW